MTQLLASGGLGHVFKNSTQTAAYLTVFTRQQEEARLRREKSQDVQDDAAEFIDLAMAMISATEADTFRLELDLYDTATVEALERNEIELREAQIELNKTFAKAHVLPDGRRVFKTEDGLRVFDEHGQELSEDIIHTEEIDNSRPSWEIAKKAIDRLDGVTRERTEILTYQGNLDNARERLNAGDMTRKEFDELREDLKADMPDAVRAQVPGMETQQMQASTNTMPQAEELNIDDDMTPTAPVIKASTPSFGG